MAQPIFFLVCKIASGYVKFFSKNQNHRLWQDILTLPPPATIITMNPPMDLKTTR